MKPRKIDHHFVESMKQRYKKSKYSLPKWIQFIEVMLSFKYKVFLYEAKSTFSKYVYVQHNGKTFKIRFSNHKPNKQKERINDCDFFVGVNNFIVTKTEDAIIATHKYFKGD